MKSLFDFVCLLKLLVSLEHALLLQLAIEILLVCSLALQILVEAGCEIHQ